MICSFHLERRLRCSHSTSTPSPQQPSRPESSSSLGLRINLGALPSVDRLGPFLLVHLDRPRPATREARIAAKAVEFDPSRCEHCRKMLERGGAFVFERGQAERYVGIDTTGEVRNAA